MTGIRAGLFLGTHDLFFIAPSRTKVLDELTTAGSTLDLAVTEQGTGRDQVLLKQADTLGGIISTPVVTIGEVERVDVPFVRRELLLNQLLGQVVGT